MADTFAQFLSRSTGLSAFLIVLTGLAGPALAESSDGSSSKQQAAETSSTETSAAPSGTDSVIGVGAGLFMENSRRQGEETRQSNSSDESYDYRADDFLNGRIWYLAPLGERLRIGGALSYFGSYEPKRVPDENEEADDIEAFELGPMLTVSARAEYLVPFLDGKHLILGLQGGLTNLFPDGDFRREIESMSDQDISVFKGPRFGFDLAPLVGARWQIDQRLALRADFSVHWGRLFLFNVSDTVGGIDYERTWTAKVLRYDLGIGMEVSL